MHDPDSWTITFAGGRLDRAVHLRNDEALTRLRHAPQARTLLVGEGQSVAVDGPQTLLRAPLPSGDGAHLALLGVQDGAPLFVADATNANAGGADLEFVGLREAAAGLTAQEAALAGYAVALVAWQRTHRFCGRCGTATVSEQAGHRRRCPACGLRTFPRTDPVVTMVIESGDRALLTRRRGAVGATWSAVAGFIEPGETPEEALVREAQEEVGVTVRAVHYVGAQPWPFPHVLMLGYRALADPDLTAATVRDTEELAGARWFTRAELRAELDAGTIALPPAIAIGHRLIVDWLERGGEQRPQD
ncbi:MAG: diphosphatase [Solirubrobacteraceae bacterium]|nr:diphosphatase [Solirubrobacteraceae bacterium]